MTALALQKEKHLSIKSPRRFHRTSPFAIRGTMAHASAGKPESRVQVDNPNMYSRLHVE